MDLPVDHLAAWALAMDKGDRDGTLPAGVRLIGRDGHKRGVELTRDLEDDAEAALFADGRVYAIAGGAPLVRWLLRDRWPAGLTTVALRAVEASTLADLVDAPALDRVRSLILVDAPSRASVVARMSFASAGRAFTKICNCSNSVKSIIGADSPPMVSLSGLLSTAERPKRHQSSR